MPIPVDCGNGKLDGEEQCDDGANVSDDGCSSHCELEGSSKECATPGGVTIQLGDNPVIITESTVGNTTDGSASCGGAGAGDVRYEIIPSKSGDFRVTITNHDYYALISIQTGCDNGELICHKKETGYWAEFPVTQDVPVYLLVTGFNNEEGTFHARLEFTN